MKSGILIILFVFMTSVPLLSQQSIEELISHHSYHRRGIHDGNQIRTSFGNDGQIGLRDSRDFTGEWPKNSNHVYLTKIVMLPMAEVRDTFGNIQHIVSECHGTGTTLDYTSSLQASVGDLDQADGRWMTMCPLPGFYNPAFLSLSAAEGSPAMSDQPNTWPFYWPDRMYDTIDPGWSGRWNGYFGKGKFNADQESFFVADDYQNDEFDYYPDENNLNRRGMGLRISYRGLQWNNPLVEDVMYMIYDVENIGTKPLEKVNFAMLPDIDPGNTRTQLDPNPDKNSFEKEKDWFYIYDQQWVDNHLWSYFHPIAFVGYALYETPGNEFDGIDNDQDGVENPDVPGATGTGKTIDETDFDRGILLGGDPIIVVDYSSYERTPPTTLDSMKIKQPDLFSGDTLIIEFIGRQQKFWPGMALVEIPFDNFDNNLNGLIDENNGTELESGQFSYIYTGNLAVDYFTKEGLDNPMIDESRKDGIDNDGDWNFFDDKGVDGLEGTGDPGEGDGKPSSKYEWIGDSLFVHESATGEEHIDATDITESDMIGMTSYFSTEKWQDYGLKEDEILWNTTKPGKIEGISWTIQVSFMGSGYFPLPAGHIERYSGAFMFNNSLEGLRRTKDNAQDAYDGNYQFYKAPERPTLTAVAGDGKVGLYWDDIAEYSVDPVLGMDFEGYRIYRSTGINFEDMIQITDAFGDQKLMWPIAQFDLDDGFTGLSTGVLEGVQFYLGDDTGLAHEWVDTTVVNGQRYIYFISSYDFGAAVPPVPPTECNYSINLDENTGDVSSMSSNVVVVTPNPPSAGYKPAPEDVSIARVEGYTDAGLRMEVFDSPEVKDNNEYRLSFEDTVMMFGSYKRAQLVTKSVTLKNLTTGTVLLDRSHRGIHGVDFPVLEGFKLYLDNPPVVKVDSASRFERAGVYKPTFETFYKGTTGRITADDYLIEFGEVGIDTSTAFKPNLKDLPAKPVNFTITNLISNKKIKFSFYDQDPFPVVPPDEAGKFTYNTGRVPFSDEIYFLEEDESGELVTTWMVTMGEGESAADTTNPLAGDVLHLKTIKPALSRDVFEFTTEAEKIVKQSIKTDMAAIKVVPNPYVVSNSWERANPYSTGRGPRELHFTHLPPRCTIRIFDIAGQHVRTIERNTSAWLDGTEVWDMRSKDGLEIGFGVFIYYIEAPEIGEKTGKFAVIK